MSKHLKRLLTAVMVTAIALAFTACGGSKEVDKEDKEAAEQVDADDEEVEEPAEEPVVERVATDSGAISVEPLNIPDYVTKAKDGVEKISMEKEEDGGGRILIDGSNKDSEDGTWEMRCPSYVNGEEYTLDMMLADFEAKDTYHVQTYTKIQIGEQEYLANEGNSTSMNYYTVANNHPVLVQVVGTDQLDEDAVMNMIKSIEFNY